MEIRYPNYYKKFQCIAGDCPDTCCAGWEIPVDAASERRYKEDVKRLNQTRPAFVKKLKKYIKNGYIISESPTCPFLNEEGLCEMYLELGPDSLCHTCARHPRHLEDYGNLHEMVLLLSCPEVARLVLEENDGGFYVRQLPERYGDMEGIDEELLGLLLQIREVIWKIGRDKAIPMNQRMAFALALGHDVQRRFVKEKRGEIATVLQKYAKDGAAGQFFLKWKPEKSNDRLKVELIDAFARLETVYQGWPQLAEKARNPKRKLTYANPMDEAWASIFEYYIYSFLFSALYDGDVLTKIKMAVCCTWISTELTAVKLYSSSDADRDIDKLIRKEMETSCHVVARQIENSSENRSVLEQMMKMESFRSRRIIDFLLGKK